MEFKDVVTLYFERSDAMQTFWNFYVTVTLALIGFFAATHLGESHSRVALILTLAFLGFASVNLAMLHDNVKQRIKAKELIHTWECKDSNDSKVQKEIVSTLKPSWRAVLFVHLVGDIGTCCYLDPLNNEQNPAALKRGAQLIKSCPTRSPFRLLAFGFWLSLPCTALPGLSLLSFAFVLFSQRLLHAGLTCSRISGALDPLLFSGFAAKLNFVLSLPDTCLPEWL